MITAHSLTKRYGAATAVDHLTFEVLPGAVTGFLGPNGSGKSTTMRMIMGLDFPDSGSALIGGKLYSELAWPLREVGAVLDSKAFHPARTARNHLRWLALSNDIPLARVDEVLDQVGLTSVANRRAGKFSLGMSQRLGIAATLLGDPGVLLFDEPVNGLDPEGIRWLRHLLRTSPREAGPCSCPAICFGIVGVFIVGVLGMAGLLLTVVIVGAPILASSLRAARGFGRWQRTLALRVLGEEIAEPEPFSPRPGFLGRLRGSLGDRTAWRSAGYLVAKVPLTLFGGWFALGIWRRSSASLRP